MSAPPAQTHTRAERRARTGTGAPPVLHTFTRRGSTSCTPSGRQLRKSWVKSTEEGRSTQKGRAVSTSAHSTASFVSADVYGGLSMMMSTWADRKLWSRARAKKSCPSSCTTCCGESEKQGNGVEKGRRLLAKEARAGRTRRAAAAARAASARRTAAAAAVRAGVAP